MVHAYLDRNLTVAGLQCVESPVSVTETTYLTVLQGCYVGEDNTTVSCPTPEGTGEGFPLSLHMWSPGGLSCEFTADCKYNNKLTFLSYFSFFFKKVFGGHMSLFWGHWYLCFGFLVASPMGFKARVGSALFAFLQRQMLCTFPEIHLWCYVCRSLSSRHLFFFFFFISMESNWGSASSKIQRYSVADPETFERWGQET